MIIRRAIFPTNDHSSDEVSLARFYLANVHD